MKFLVDLFPIALFFVTFKLAGIYVATGVAIAATLLQIGWLYFRNGKVEAMQWVSLVIIVLFGGATLLFHDDTFIKWKPTVLYWLMGAALVLGHFVMKRNFLQALMGAQIQLPEPIWLRLLWAWSGFFALMGVVNLWVAFNFDLDTWVSYKLFGGMGLMLVFVVAQAMYLSRHIIADEATPDKTSEELP
jgi:intracellular septation protein